MRWDKILFYIFTQINAFGVAVGTSQTRSGCFNWAQKPSKIFNKWKMSDLGSDTSKVSKKCKKNIYNWLIHKLLIGISLPKSDILHLLKIFLWFYLFFYLKMGIKAKFISPIFFLCVLAYIKTTFLNDQTVKYWNYVLTFEILKKLIFFFISAFLGSAVCGCIISTITLSCSLYYGLNRDIHLIQINEYGIRKWMNEWINE